MRLFATDDAKEHALEETSFVQQSSMSLMSGIYATHILVYLTHF